MAKDLSASRAIVGAWKLDHFEEISQGDVYQYADIVIFSKRYYSDFQSDRSDASKSVNCHVGVYDINQDSITFKIQLSNRPESIGRVARGTFIISGDILKITFMHGEQPGTWVYKKLSE